jgi:hypothetical protein
MNSLFMTATLKEILEHSSIRTTAAFDHGASMYGECPYLNQRRKPIFEENSRKYSIE